MEAYLDNSATTRCSKAAADMVYKLLTEDYGNPSSLHMKGVEAENYINDVSYEAVLLDGSLGTCHITKHCKEWFKTKDELIDYLKTQIDRVTTDDYTINYEAH